MPIKPTINLIEEHGAIALMLKVIEKVSARIESHQKVNPQHLKDIVGFLQDYAEKCHHGKEEEILFPAMLRDNTNQHIVNELLGEHMLAHDLVSGMRQAADNYAPGNLESYHFAKNAKAYVQLLKSHIHDENLIAFPRAEAALTVAQQAKMSEGFNRIEQTVLGNGKHRLLETLLHRLQKEYLD